MADRPHYEVPTENLKYNDKIPILLDSDPARASTVFNPLIQELVDNIHYTKTQAERNIDGGYFEV